MPLTLPPGKRMAVALTFDFDAHSNWMGSLGRTSLSYLSRGDFGAEEGFPRILLEEFGFAWDSSLMGREFELYRPRRVEVNYESASVFGAPAKFVEIPVSWYLDDWPAVEYVPGVSPLGTHTDMIDRWKTIFNFAYTRVPGAVYNLTMHPQTIGRSHHLLDEMAGHNDIWYATLSELADAWHD
jgi:hypothetical protein